MSHEDDEGVPHLWLVGTRGWVCVVGGHPYEGTAAPYGACVMAQPYATDAIDRAEQESGLSIVDMAQQLGALA